MSFATISEDAEYAPLDSVNAEGEFAMLATRLEDSITNPLTQDDILRETIHKLRKVDSSLSRLKSRITSLSFENKELSEALTTLHESHETRTEASGTESELVHGKTPSIHSDLSDSESDDPNKLLGKSPPIVDNQSSFQESGIFVSSCELVNASTQTAIETAEISQQNLERNSRETKNENCEFRAVLAKVTSVQHISGCKDTSGTCSCDNENDAISCSSSTPGQMDESQVSLTKNEYNNIVCNERKLQREIEVLQCDKEQLTLLNSSLEEQIKNFKNTLMNEEPVVLRAQLRLLEEKLENSDRCKNEYFDEKCEMEEAENDARLLAQRLESQLEASREMESLLSASLSQEQEFCRELQRRVREMQEIDKDRRKHEEMLENDLEMYKELHLSTETAIQTPDPEITFALYGVILAHYWQRDMILQNPKALVPKSSAKEDYSLHDIFRFTSESWKEFENVSSVDLILDGLREHDTEVLEKQTDDRKQSNNNSASTDKTVKQMKGKHSRREDNVNDTEEVRQREEFYLCQIDSLQKEKKKLREDFEAEHSHLLDQMQNIKTERNRVQQSLEESQQEKCKLLFKLEEAQISLSDFEIDKEGKIQELKREFNQSLDSHHQERKDVERKYEQQITELKSKNESDKERFNSLLQQFSVLQKEIEPFLEGNSSELAELTFVENGSRSLTTKGLLTAVRHLVKSESISKEKIRELEKKEYAYRETINEADRIMANHVTIYTQRIEELEGKLDQKEQKISQLERSEDRLRGAMKSNWKTGESARISELLDRLIETENSELILKERVWNLEKNGKELQIKFVEAEKTQENLRNELKDQDELMQKIMLLTTENKTLTSCLDKAQQAARRSNDFQQSENYLTGRVEELESTENGLRTEVEQLKHTIKQRELKILNLEEELFNLRLTVDERVSELNKGVDQCGFLRQQNESLKNQVKTLKEDLKNTSSESISHESQHRTEVTKLRSQLKLANSQLTDLDSLNGELKERLTENETALRKALIDLEASIQQHEKEMSSMASKLNEKEQKIEEFEKHTNQESLSSMLSELDLSTVSNIASLQQALDSVQESSKECKHCKAIQSQLNITMDSLRDLGRVQVERLVTSDSEVEAESESNSTTNSSKSSNDTEPETTVDGPSVNDAKQLSEALEKTLPAVPPRLKRGTKKKRQRSIQCSSPNDHCRQNATNGSSANESGPCSKGCCYNSDHFNNLKEKISSLEEAVDLRNKELRLVDSEAGELQHCLIEREERLKKVTQEANRSNEDLCSLRQQYTSTVQEYEKNHKALETKHKIQTECHDKKIRTLREDVQVLMGKSSLKDKIISRLLQQICALLRCESTVVLVNQIKRIEEERVEENESVTDFNVSKVCEVLQAPMEMVTENSLSHIRARSSSLTSGIACPPVNARKKSLVPVSTSAKGFIRMQHSTASATSIKSLPPLEHRKKSRIPRLRSLTCTSLKHEKISSHCTLLSYNKHSISSESKHIPRQAEVKRELRSLSSKPQKSLNSVKVSTKTKKMSIDESTPNRFITDARKIKRMITGLVPINAEVDCSSAPEWKKQPHHSVPSCIPRPSGLRITRRVGLDGAVIAWDPLEHDCVAGFQVIFGGKVVQQVRSPHRTKALVTGLPYPGPFTICLVAVSNEGLCSVPTGVTHEQSNAYKPKLSKTNYSIYSSSTVTPRKAIVTNL